jgi:two-component system LytT family response regulator
MIKLRTVIIDDETTARNALQQMLTHYAPQVEIIDTADSVAAGIQLLTTLAPDVVLLDIEMKDGTGFDLLKQLPDPRFKIIFTTAYSTYALQAFKFSALDYLLKPIDPDDLVASLEKAGKWMNKEHLQVKLDAFLHNLGSENRKIILNTAESMHVVPIQEIIRCEAMGSYTQFFLTGNRKIMVSKMLKEYEDLLGTHRFFRLHHSHLVNLNQIERYDKKDGGTVVMRDKSILPVAVRKKDQLIQVLKSL